MPIWHNIQNRCTYVWIKLRYHTTQDKCSEILRRILTLCYRIYLHVMVKKNMVKNIRESALTTLKYMYINHEDQRFFYFEIILNLFFIFFRFIWIPMVLVCDQIRIFAEIYFRRQNLTSTDVRFWCLKSIPATSSVNYNIKYGIAPLSSARAGALG